MTEACHHHFFFTQEYSDNKLFACWVIFHVFLLSITFFFKKFFQYLAVWIQIRTDSPKELLNQTVCKGYQQTNKVAPSKERVKALVFDSKSILISH